MRRGGSNLHRGSLPLETVRKWENPKSGRNVHPQPSVIRNHPLISGVQVIYDVIASSPGETLLYPICMKNGGFTPTCLAISHTCPLWWASCMISSSAN